MAEVKMTVEDIKSVVSDIVADEVAEKYAGSQAALKQVVLETVKSVRDTELANQSPYTESTHDKYFTFMGRSIKAHISYRRDREQGKSVGEYKTYVEKYLENLYGSDTKYMAHVKEILATENDGGILVKEEWADYFIDQLFKSTFLDRLNVRREVINDRVKIPVILDGIAAQFVGEMQEIDASKLKLSEVSLEPRILKSMSLITNYLLESNAYSADRMITENMMKNMRIVMETAFIYGDGGYEPRGMANVPGILEHGTTGSTLNYDYLVDAITVFGENEMDPEGVQALINWDAWRQLRKEKSQTGEYLNKEDMAAGRLLGEFEYIRTNIVKAGEIYFVKGSEVIVANKMDVEVTTSNTATVKFKDGNLNLWGASATGFLAVAMFDYSFPQPKAILKGLYQATA